MTANVQDPDRPSRTDRVLEFIREFRAQRQVSPTIREIGRGVGISSTSVVNFHVGKLLADGQLLRAVGRGAPRNLVPADGKVAGNGGQRAAGVLPTEDREHPTVVGREDGFVD